ncbi:methyltransferase [Streptomyces sp. NPDC001262]|uniref:methyltransferase n=1 Tax=Streptomyces sp. NPDC001262 TaxID=3364552 RepID=UPI00369D53C7
MTEYRSRMMQLAFGPMIGHLIGTALRLGVLDRIGEGERSAEELAAEGKADLQSTTRMLRALTGIGLLAETAPGTFAATETGAFLRTDHPESMAFMVKLLTDPSMLRSWEHLGESVRTGEPYFATVFGKDYFSFLKDNPELSEHFNIAMSQGTRVTAQLLPKACDFGRFGVVADIGGGDGTLLAGILRAHPALRGILYDSAEGLSQAGAKLERAGLAGRCELVAGDFFVSAPAGADAYVIKSVLHDWSDDQAATILGHVRAVLPADGRVIVIETVLPDVADDRQEGLNYMSDLNMLVNLGGRERTRDEFAELFSRAGLSLASVVPVGPQVPYCVIEAEAV